jgi:ubiquinone biosynthesis protein UbiJ
LPSSVLIRPILAALNHVLAQQVWAGDRLRTHAGRRVCIELDGPLGTVRAQCRISDRGLLESVSSGDSGSEGADVTLRLKASADSLSALFSRGVEGLAGHLRIEGDVMLAATVAEVARHLRWDVEEDLSRVVGDALAHRTVRSVRDQWSAAQGLADRSLKAMSRFWLDDPAGVVDRPRAQALDLRLQGLEAAVTALERQRPGLVRTVQRASKSD